MDTIDDLGSPWRNHIIEDLEMNDKETVNELAANLGEKDDVQPVEDIIRDRDEYKDKWLRALADYQNLKRTTEKQYAEAFDRGRIALFRTLLPVIDDLDRAVCNDVDYKGLKLIYDKLMKLIVDASIERIAPENGDEFNLDLHDALFADKTDADDYKGKIRSTLLAGYKMKNSSVANPVIRHAQVTTWEK